MGVCQIGQIGLAVRDFSCTPATNDKAPRGRFPFSRAAQNLDHSLTIIKQCEHNKAFTGDSVCQTHSSRRRVMRRGLSPPEPADCVRAQSTGHVRRKYGFRDKTCDS